MKHLFQLVIWCGLAAPLWAQQEATLWDLPPEPWLTEAQTSILAHSYRPHLPAADFNRFFRAVEDSNWRVASELLRQNGISSFSDFVRRRGSERFSSGSLALHLYIFRQMNNNQPVWLYAGRADNLGYFHDASRILESSELPKLSDFERLGLEYEWALLTGLHENSQVRRRSERLSRSGSRMRSHIRALRVLATEGDIAELKAAVMSSLVNSQSTRRLSREGMRQESSIRDYRFGRNLSDGIFQLLALGENELRGVILSGELPEDFVSSHAKSFEKLLSELRAEAVRENIAYVTNACRAS